MKKFVSQRRLHIPVQVEGLWRTLHFQETQGGYEYTPKSEEECEELLKHPYCESGDINVVEVQATPTHINKLNLEMNEKHYAKAEADKKKREIVEGIGSCSDARAYLRERFGDEEVALRSKKEILEYADTHNIYFTDL